MSELKLDYIEQGDCIELMKNIPDNSINTIITSPPYNKKGLNGVRGSLDTRLWNRLNIDYDEYGDNMDEREYVKWQINFLNECNRVLKEDGSIFYNHKIRRHNRKAYFPQWIFYTKNNFYQMIIWDRKSCYDMQEDYLYPTTELIFWLTKNKPKCFKSEAYYQKEIWDIAPVQTTKSRQSKEHPAPFPDQLVENCIILTTEKGDVVLDPFVGSGTTAFVAKYLQRHYIGFDISEKYVNLSLDRLSEISDYYSL